MANIVITYKKDLMVSVPCEICIGLIDDQNILTNITRGYGLLPPSVTIESLDGNASFLFRGSRLYIIVSVAGVCGLKVTYGGLVNYVSLWVIQNLKLPDTLGFLNLFKSLLPNNCYTWNEGSANYADMYATSDLMSEVYNNSENPSLTQLYKNIYPPTCDDQRWETLLNDGPPWTDSYDFGLVVQTVRNTFLMNVNPYDSSWTISKYIHARTGKSCYVYIAPNDPIDVYVRNEDLSLTAEFLQELSHYITKLFEPQMTFVLTQVTSLAPYGIFVFIGDVYKQDPRLFGPYALVYNPHAVYDTQALASPYNPKYIVGYYIDPTKASRSPGSTITMRAILEYRYPNSGIIYKLDVTADSSFESADPTIVSVTGGNVANFNDYGTTTITATYIDLPFETQVAIATYKVEDDLWILGVSTLGDDTILG